MRKNKWLLPKIMIYFAFVAINLSCEKEEFKEQNLDSQKFRVKEVKLQNLMNESKFNNLLQNITDNSVLQRSSFENQNGFTIYNDVVKIIETDSLTSYTMQILCDNPVDNISFYNLVIQEDIFNNQKAAIYKYTPNSISSTTHNSFHFDGTIDKFSLGNSANINRVSNEQSLMSECYDFLLYCNNNGSGGVGEEHPAGANCKRTYIKKIKVICTSPPFDGGFGNTGGGGGDGPNEFPSDENNEIITTPILTVDNPRPLTNPCNRVKNITNNTPNLKSKITNFKTPQVLNLNYEKGFNFVDNAQNQTQLVQNDGNANSTSIPVITLVDGSMTGVLHSHFDRPDMLPTFTFEDLMTFNSIYQYRKYNQKSLDKLTLMVVTRAGVFAMMIENESMFDINGHNLWTDQNAQLYNKFYENILGRQNLTDEDVIVEVTKGLASYGIGLYEANSDLSNWSKITVDANNNKVSTPCN
jgi:hypothetical protein